MPNGKAIGVRGNSSRVRIIKGGNEEAKRMFDLLSKNGKPETPASYPGKGMRLPNGGWIGYRNISKSNLPTVETHIEGIEFEKIHFTK